MGCFEKMDKLGTKGLRLFESRAAEYIKDKGKLSNLLNLAMRKGMSSDSIRDAWERLQLAVDVLKDWVSGEYKELPKRSLIILTAALLYFITPVDLVPDFIPLSGYLDDVTVIAYVYSQITKDLEAYKAWKEKRNHTKELIEEQLDLVKTGEENDNSKKVQTEVRSDDADQE